MGRQSVQKLFKQTYAFLHDDRVLLVLLLDVGVIRYGGSRESVGNGCC